MEKKLIHLDHLFADPNWEGPEIIYGTNLIKEATNTTERYAVMTMEIPWGLVKDDVVKQPEAVLYVPNTHLSTFEALEAQVPEGVEMVIGIGGGSSHDAAKFVAIKRQIRLLQFPTIFGGDSVVCSAVGLREERRVKYIGHSRAEKVYVDFDVIRKAPPQLVRYGASDILSSYTALMDWEYAASKGKAQMLDDAYNYAKNTLLPRLINNAAEINQLTNQGIKTMVDLFMEYAKLANRNNTDRAQEGSEHFVAYNAEYVTRRTFVHGSLLSMGIYIVGSYFYDKHDEIDRLLNEMGQQHTLKSFCLSADETRETLRTLQKFVHDGNYYHSIVHDVALSDAEIEAIIRDISK